jgi:hypothetical protein
MGLATEFNLLQDDVVDKNRANDSYSSALRTTGPIMVFEILRFSLGGVVFLLVIVGIYYLFWWQDFEGMRSTFEYHQKIRKRERLSGEAFYQRFYADSGLPPDLVVAVRDFYASYWEEDPELLYPEDDLLICNSGVDLVDWANKAEKLFGVVIPEDLPPEIRDNLPRVDQTFDTFVRYIHLAQNQQKLVVDPASGGT